MGILDYFKKKKTLLGNHDLIKRALIIAEETKDPDELFSKIRNEVNIDFADGVLDKIPSDKEVKELIKLIKLKK
ncbi:hypothetical protein G7081_05835 [Vagococcus coleopterorum]|uniref:Uncharacterized protein n=1 Tax=Vagococcus coleopterorum TaxID=2714946 RepID=A0A6G8ANT2_9ENTE|nr:hypothetical protein [Vagococcus coleopterorum]QIL46630.1 hypothetical protein G7081_05835 [Vagococcus coleopterorum]